MADRAHTLAEQIKRTYNPYRWPHLPTHGRWQGLGTGSQDGCECREQESPVAPADHQ